MKVEEIRLLIEEREYDNAIAACNELLDAGYSSGRREILRLREWSFAMQNQFDRAVEDFVRIFQSSEGTIDDYFQGAFRSLEAKQLTRAVEWFLKVLELADEKREMWYKSATLFYLAFALMELERYEEARKRLIEGVTLEADLELPIPHVGMCTADQMLLEIERRSPEM